ncbi:MAG TPA: AI-2E family transporter [Xanthomonadales bacterium]|nr:AI-2E family transporter [Xanthomonadales bacterium]
MSAPHPLPPETGAPTPFTGRVAVRRWLGVVGVIVVVFALYFARAFVLPIVFSVLVSLVLSPAVRALTQARFPRALASLVVVAGMLCAFGGVAMALAGPGQEWLERAPVAVDRMEQRIRELRRPFKAATEATQKMMELGQEASPRGPVVVTQSPGIALEVLKQAPFVIASAIASVFLVFLLLLHGDELMRKFVTLVPRLSHKKELVLGTRELQRELSRYLLTVSAINVCLGLVTALCLYFLGVSDPLLWAGVVAVFNFAPYVGPAITAFVLLVVGFAEFDTVPASLAVPGCFLLLHAIEGQLVTPLLCGRRLALDPVMIFIGLMLFGWMWGIVGLLLAVPMLSCIRIVATHVPGAETLARLITSESSMRSIRDVGEEEAPPQGELAFGPGPRD